MSLPIYATTGQTIWYYSFRVICGLIFFFLIAPIIIIIPLSFNAQDFFTFTPEMLALDPAGFSTKHYEDFFTNQDWLRPLKNSLIIAFTATVFSTGFATVGAIALKRNREMRRKNLFQGTLMMPLMIPEIVTAIATLSFFSAIGLKLGRGNFIIAHTVFCIPFAFLPIQARLAGMDETLELAARDLYSRNWTALRLITIPLLMPGILSGAMLAFIVSLDDFIITLMVADAGSSTLPIYIYSLVRVGITPEVNAVSTVLLALSTVGVVLSTALGKRK